MDGELRRRRGDGEYLNSIGNADDLQEQRRDEELVARSSQGWNAFFIAFAVAGVLLGCILTLLPSPIQPVAFSLPAPPELTGPLTPNEILTQAERLFEDELKGPESIVIDGDSLYTGTVDGRIVKMCNGDVSTLVTLGKGENCGSFDTEPECGRPFGMRLNKERHLLVADTFLGIFKVDLKTGVAEQLLSSQDPVAGQQQFKFLNDIEEGEEGVIYFTDSSTRWDRRYHKYIILEADMTGRLLSYNPKTQEVKELAGGLAFANGLAISVDKTYILVAETVKARIVRYHLKGPRQGQTDIFADNLPGWPDNIRHSGRGTYWVAVASVRHAGKFSILDFAASHPWIRALLAKFVSQETMTSMIPTHGLLLEFNEEGKIVRSLHDPHGVQGAYYNGHRIQRDRGDRPVVLVGSDLSLNVT